MTRTQFGRLIQMDKQGWIQMDDDNVNAEPACGGPIHMRRGKDEVIVDNDGSARQITDEGEIEIAPMYRINVDDRW